MSPGMIVTLIIMGIVVMVGAALIAQSVENARKERLRLISIINERIRHLTAIIHDTPNHYMLPELRQFITSLLQKNCSAILAIEANHAAAKAQLQQLKEFSQQTFPNELESLQPPFQDLVTGQNIRKRIKDLVNLIVTMNKEGELDKATAVKFINQGKMMFELISIDIALISARSSEQNEKTLKVALINYKSCLKNLIKMNTKSQFNHRINHLTAKTQQLQKQVDSQMAQAAALSAAAPEHSKQGSLDTDDWRIKQDYE